jgi:hypothetical protein
MGIKGFPANRGVSPSISKTSILTVIYNFWHLLQRLISYLQIVSSLG